jgi:hypothetical protein
MERGAENVGIRFLCGAFLNTLYKAGGLTNDGISQTGKD